MNVSPFGRFCMLLVLSPFVPWGAAWFAIYAEWLEASYSTGFTYHDWIVVIGITAPVFVFIAGCVGLLRLGPIMAAAVLVAAVCVPAGFMLIGLFSLGLPMGAWLGAFPAFALASLDKSDRVAGY